MTDLFNLIINNPMYLTITIILSAVVVFSIVKKLFKYAAILIIICMLYFGYLYYTDQEIPINADDIMNDMGINTEEVIDGIEGAVENLKEKAVESLKKKTEDMIKNAEKTLKEKNP